MHASRVQVLVVHVGVQNLAISYDFRLRSPVPPEQIKTSTIGKQRYQL